MTKKIFKSIGLIALAVAVAIGSFFVPISKNDTSNFAGAYSFNDNTFISSDLLYGRLSNSSSIGNLTSSSASFSDIGDFSTFANLSFKLSLTNYTSNIIEITPSIKGVWSSDTPLFSNNSWYNFNRTIYYNVSSSTIASSFVFNEFVNFNNTSYGLIGFFMDFSYLKEDGSIGVTNRGVSSGNFVRPTGDIKSIEIGSKSDFNLLGYDLSSELPTQGSEVISFANSHWDTNFTFVAFTDTNNYRYIFIIPYFNTDYILGNPGSNTSGLLEYRKYYITPFNNLSNNDYYLQGYQQGLADNQSSIYNNGYNTGFDDGFEDGKITGAVEANDYSFFSLFGAIFDAPVTLFTSLLNFEFLGINLWSFITSLLTLAIILFVVKLFIRR